MSPKVTIFPDLAALNHAAVQRWIGLYREAVRERGVFHVALAGGSTPRQLYRQLSHPDIARKVDWERVHIYFGDERSVPCDHPASNYRMAKESLLDRVPIPASHIHRMKTELDDMGEVARRYEEVLLENLPVSDGGVPLFDLILLGIGPDGHTASLFPGTDILNERERFVAAVYVEEKTTWRVSLTFPVIDSARHILFLVAGKDKQQVVKMVLSGTPTSPPLPVQMLHPAGEVEILLDSEAAGEPASGEGESPIDPVPA